MSKTNNGVKTNCTMHREIKIAHNISGWNPLPIKIWLDNGFELGTSSLHINFTIGSVMRTWTFVFHSTIYVYFDLTGFECFVLPSCWLLDYREDKLPPLQSCLKTHYQPTKQPLHFMQPSSCLTTSRLRSCMFFCVRKYKLRSYAAFCNATTRGCLSLGLVVFAICKQQNKNVQRHPLESVESISSLCTKHCLKKLEYFWTPCSTLFFNVYMARWALFDRCQIV